MRFVKRIDLDGNLRKDLDRRQADIDQKQSEGKLIASTEWKKARTTRTLESVLGKLKSMMGGHERCMYCLDSHGSDIDHFWPKASYPERMFRWLNLLLCCTECGRYKADQFPLAEGLPLLVDPTAEEPWAFLDFDPATGNIVARFDANKNQWLTKGLETVKILHLDRREALAAGHQKTYRRLKERVVQAITQTELDAGELLAHLRDVDNHGLLGWCFLGTGQYTPPFCELRERHPKVWAACIDEIPHP